MSMLLFTSLRVGAFNKHVLSTDSVQAGARPHAPKLVMVGRVLAGGEVLQD